ncbi:hypothetical protein G7Z17_g8355 [Cylindrodendrum hubeiense]|uniref:Uncharacterized protein n=1 Tax=Cylindrodendrum hubeiense TaxID=595255 RepID=A0A9P5LDA1_9HYPO|nr:hypothetical protein G7Z17_g8355 [Cylindrodendrum hubeiense]
MTTVHFAFHTKYFNKVPNLLLSPGHKVPTATQTFILQIDLVEGEIRRLGIELSLPRIIGIIEKEAGNSIYFPWVAMYLESRVHEFLTIPTLDIAYQLFSELSSPTTTSQIILRSMIKHNFGEVEAMAARQAEEEKAQAEEDERMAEVMAHEKEKEEAEMELAAENNEIVALRAKERRKGKLKRTDRVRLNLLEERAAERAEERATMEAEELLVTAVASVSSVIEAEEPEDAPAPAEAKEEDTECVVLSTHSSTTLDAQQDAPSTPGPKNYSAQPETHTFHFGSVPSNNNIGTPDDDMSAHLAPTVQSTAYLAWFWAARDGGKALICIEDEVAAASDEASQPRTSTFTSPDNGPQAEDISPITINENNIPIPSGDSASNPSPQDVHHPPVAPENGPAAYMPERTPPPLAAIPYPRRRLSDAPRASSAYAEALDGSDDHVNGVPFYPGDKRGPAFVMDICEPHKPLKNSHFFVPMPSIESMQPEDVDYLRSKGIFSLPPQHMREALIHSYFHHIHPFAPVLDAANFIPKYEKGRVSLLLLWSIFLAAASFIDDSIATIIVLYRPFIFDTPRGFPPSQQATWRDFASQKTRTAASEAISAVNSMMAENLIGLCHTITVLALLPPMQIHLLESTSLKPMTSQMGKHNLALCMLAMGELRKSYVSAGAAFKLFERAKNKIDNATIREAPLQTPPARSPVDAVPIEGNWGSYTEGYAIATPGIMSDLWAPFSTTVLDDNSELLHTEAWLDIQNMHQVWANNRFEPS